MFARLQALFAAGRLTEAQVYVAVGKGWISMSQATEIVGSS